VAVVGPELKLGHDVALGDHRSRAIGIGDFEPLASPPLAAFLRRRG
jgi:hypothetical protein